MSSDAQSLYSPPRRLTEKAVFLRILGFLRRGRLASLESLVESNERFEALSAASGILHHESLLSIWNPRRLREARRRRELELLAVCIQEWDRAHNDRVRYCSVCNLLLNVGQWPGHQEGTMHRKVLRRHRRNKERGFCYAAEKDLLLDADPPSTPVPDARWHPMLGRVTLLQLAESVPPDRLSAVWAALPHGRHYAWDPLQPLEHVSGSSSTGSRSLT